MPNFATNMKLGNEANEVDVTNTRNYRTSLSQIVKDVHTFSKKKGCGVYFVVRSTRVCSC